MKPKNTANVAYPAIPLIAMLSSSALAHEGHTSIHEYAGGVSLLLIALGLSMSFYCLRKARTYQLQARRELEAESSR